MGWLLKIIEVTRRIPWPVRYASSFAFVLASFGIHAALDGVNQPYLFCIPAIVFSATLFDRGTGFFATLLSAALIALFVLEPRGEFFAAKLTDGATLLAFIAVGSIIASVIEGLHLLTKQLRDATASLRTSLIRSEQLAAEKAALSAEMSHRIKNNLQITASVLAMQARRGDPEVAAKLRAAADRVGAMARIHNVVERRDDPNGVPARLFMPGLCADLRDALVAEHKVEIHCAAPPDLVLTMDQASTIGLIVNELVTNALKHAFPGGRKGNVHVDLTRDGRDFLLSVKDDGVGFSEDAPLGLGRRLIEILAAKLGGSLSVDCRTGCEFRLRFPAQPPTMAEGLSDATVAEALSQARSMTA